MPIAKQPPVVSNYQKEERRIGVEIEFANVSADVSLQVLVGLYGGDILQHSVFDYTLKESRLGDFRIELDSSQLKALGEKVETLAASESSNSLLTALPLLSKAAELLVPWEIVAPPMALSYFSELFPLIEKLRDHGALGTRHAPQYAFGLHLNPELPDLSAATILNYFRAYLCLYEWIVSQEDVDWARKITPYIRHFDNDYIDYVLQASYAPDMDQLIDDYLKWNATRNRSLDLLPLFAFINSHKVRRIIDDPRIKPRPTFHYRLPNCDIDNPNWNLHQPWHHWLQVEYLANDTVKLQQACAAYQDDRTRFTRSLDSQWLTTIEDYLEPL